MKQKLSVMNISVLSISASLIFLQSLLLLISALVNGFELTLLPLIFLTFLLPVFFSIFRWCMLKKNQAGQKEPTALQLRLFSCAKVAYQLMLFEYYISLKIHEGLAERVLVGIFFQINVSQFVLELRQINAVEQAAYLIGIHLYVILRISGNVFSATTVAINCLHLIITSTKLKREAKTADLERESKNKRIQYFERLIKEVLPCGIIFLETSSVSTELLISYNKFFFSLFEPKSPDSEGSSPRKMRPSLGTNELNYFLSELKVFFREENPDTNSRSNNRSVSIRIKTPLRENEQQNKQIELNFIAESLKHIGKQKEGDYFDESNLKLDNSNVNMNLNDNSLTFGHRPAVKNLLDIKAMLTSGWFSLLEALPSPTLYDYERDCVNLNLVYEPKQNNLESNKNNSFEIRSFSYNLQICRVIREDDSVLYLLLFTDISAVEHMKDLENQDQQKNKLLSTISHNLKTPLHGIIGVFDELEAISFSQNDELVKIGKRSALILDSLINDLLDFSLISSGKLTLREDIINIATFTRDILEIVRSQARFKGLELLEERDNALPKYIITDEQRLRQILLNLLSNAIKFTEKGSVTFSIGFESTSSLTQKNILIPSGDSRGGKKYRTHIAQLVSEQMPISVMGKNHRSLMNSIRTVEVREENTQYNDIIFCVSDTGIGMTRDEISTIFKLFNKNERKSSKPLPRMSPGSGIGLVITNALTKKLNPKNKLGLQLESEFMAGSKFWFTIPCKLKLDSTDVLDELNQIAMEEKPNFSTMKDSIKSVLSGSLPLTSERETLLSKEKNEKNLIPQNLLSKPSNKPKEKPQNESGAQAAGVKSKSLFVPVRSNTSKPVSCVLDDQNPNPRIFKKRDSESMMTLPMIDLELIERMKKKKQFNNTKKHMLIVDDDIINITVATKYLESFKITYKIAENGLKALQILEEEARKGIFFDAILMDLNMPIMDGIQATKQIKEKIATGELRPVEIIACTANVSQFDRKMCSEAGMTDFMTKPLKKLELKKKLEKILDMMIEYDTPNIK